MIDKTDQIRKKPEFRHFPDLSFEEKLWADGYKHVAGIDEAGRGALAGPVVAAAVILPIDNGLCQKLYGVRDSKLMSSLARQKWAIIIKEIAMDFGVGFASNHEIDEIGILPATHLAVRRALKCFSLSPDHLLTDYLFLKTVPIPQTPLVKGDMRCLSIAAASILAKTSRDDLMCELDAEYPGYGFMKHKGYGTQYHRSALRENGPSSIHRLSFRFKTEE